MGMQINIKPLSPIPPLDRIKFNNQVYNQMQYHQQKLANIEKNRPLQATRSYNNQNRYNNDDSPDPNRKVDNRLSREIDKQIE